ncbi:MAG TPA: circularly permuted type 2 ATP-grasp protein [Sporichthyaceae bacterium]|nr:circularly permuted type 2 ATP-grasp protein [Sporichthyaceae bacterium]
MADLLEDYPFGAAWDEMFAGAGEPRAAMAGVHDAVRALAPDELRARADALAQGFLDRGVTFALGGEERPFPLDIVPRVITAVEWDVLSRGVAQRVRALEAFLADVYDRGEVFNDGVIPRRLIVTSAHFHRAAADIVPANGVRVLVSGIDVIRDEAGEFRVLEDNIRTPSGVSYVIENRRAMTHGLPEAFSSHRIMPVSHYPQRLLAAARAAAPEGAADASVVVLTPGVYNSAYFEHALLARLMGVELVEGRDLVCRRNQVYMRTTSGERRVDVIYRRIDDDFLDPLHFRADSTIGCPGLLNAAREGGVTICNAVGNGIADDKLVYSYVPELVRYYLGEEPILANVDTHRLDEPDTLEWVLEHLSELVLKPVDASGGKGIVIGPAAESATLEMLRIKVRADPRGWIAQKVVSLSTVPTLVGEYLRPRHVDLRPFAVNDGTGIWVLPGGLTRVALPEGQLVVNSSQGGGSKDTWVLASADGQGEPEPSTNAGAPRGRASDPGPIRGPAYGLLRQQEQQQQQQQLTVRQTGSDFLTDRQGESC